jgi:hypothetical protein
MERDKEMTEIFYDKNAEVDKDGEKQDLRVYEARRLIGPKSYDDNWKLTRYTSELRNEKDDSFYAFIDFESNEGNIRECPHCLEFGFHNKLYARVRKEGEPAAPDDDQFGSCHECGNTVPIYTAHYESEIKDSLETVQDPFENSESVFLSTDSRATTRRKRERKDEYRKGVHKYRSKKIDHDKQEDLDIQREIDRHGSNNVRIIQ